MKAARHALMLEIVAQQEIQTQEELADALKKQGMRVTQATVSRDIKELRLLKVLAGGGGYKYAKAQRPEQDKSERLVRIFEESVVSIDGAGSFIVIKTLSGSANAAAEAIDSLHWDEILGTIAGDNTILVILRKEDQLPDLLSRFRTMTK